MSFFLLDVHISQGVKSLHSIWEDYCSNDGTGVPGWGGGEVAVPLPPYFANQLGDILILHQQKDWMDGSTKWSFLLTFTKVVLMLPKVALADSCNNQGVSSHNLA